jgi:hypothetical protein
MFNNYILNISGLTASKRLLLFNLYCAGVFKSYKGVLFLRED